MGFGQGGNSLGAQAAIVQDALQAATDRSGRRRGNLLGNDRPGEDAEPPSPLGTQGEGANGVHQPPHRGIGGADVGEGGGDVVVLRHS